MKLRFLILLLIAGLAISTAHAQSPINVGDKQISLGAGFSGWGLPVFANYEQCFIENITFGGEIGYRNYRESFQIGDYRHHIINIAAIGNYHFTEILEIPREWDLYAGLNLGFYIWDTYDGPDGIDYDGEGSSGLGLGVQAGARYFFNDKFGFMLQIGAGNAVANGRAGVTIRLD